MATSEQVWVGTLPLATVGGIGGLKYSDAADGGCEQASWTMTLPPGSTHPSLVIGQAARVQVGPASVWCGNVTDIEREGSRWSFSAAGRQADLRDTLALTVALDTTSTPDTAIAFAQSVGVDVTLPASLSAVPFANADETIAVNTVGDLLNAWSDSVSKRWGVDADARIFATADPTVPTLALAPGTVQVGLADEDYVSQLYGRFQSGPNQYVTAVATDPTATVVRMQAVDLTPLGVIDMTKANSILQGMLARSKGRYSWTSAVTVTSKQLRTMGGEEVYLPWVKAQTMVRAYGVLQEQGPPLPYLDYVLGRVERDADADTLTLSPTNLAARNLGDNLALLPAAAA